MTSGMTITLWGVRGSIPSPGPRTARYGGNTTCVSVEVGPLVLAFDAGTGIRNLGAALVDDARPIHIFLTHLHWDHVQGLLFFGPLYQPGRRLALDTPQRQLRSLERIAGVDGIHFPLKEDQIASRLTINGSDPLAPLAAAGVRLSRMRMNHPGRCDGFRLEHAGAVFVFIPDNEINPPDSRHASLDQLVEFCRGADVLIHDAQYLPGDMPAKRGWGHSLVEEACELARAADVKTLVLFHHDPDRDDDALDAIQAECRRRFESDDTRFDVRAAAEGMTFHLGGTTANS